MKNQNIKKTMIKLLMTVLPVLAFAVNISANTIATPVNGQPVPPDSLKSHRKF